MSPRLGCSPIRGRWLPVASPFFAFFISLHTSFRYSALSKRLSKWSAHGFPPLSVSGVTSPLFSIMRTAHRTHFSALFSATKIFSVGVTIRSIQFRMSPNSSRMSSLACSGVTGDGFSPSSTLTSLLAAAASSDASSARVKQALDLDLRSLVVVGPSASSHTYLQSGPPPGTMGAPRQVGQ